MHNIEKVGETELQKGVKNDQHLNFKKLMWPNPNEGVRVLPVWAVTVVCLNGTGGVEWVGDGVRG